MGKFKILCYYENFDGVEERIIYTNNLSNSIKVLKMKNPGITSIRNGMSYTIFLRKDKIITHGEKL